MALAGTALGSALSELKGKLEGEARAEITAENERKDFDAVHQHQGKALTHHYKATHTHTYEVDDLVNEDKSNEAETTKEKTKKKRRGCFSSCFGKKE